MTKQTSGTIASHPVITTSAPSGDVGVNFSSSFFYETMNPRKVLLTIIVSTGASDIVLWGRLAQGVTGDKTDDTWGLFQDMFKTCPLGKLATALPIGTYHFVIPDVGCLAALYVQKSANNVTAFIVPIQETGQA